MQRFTILEGWRAILAWWVVLSHTMGIAGFDRPELQALAKKIGAESTGFMGWLLELIVSISFYVRSGKIPVYVFVIISGFVITHLLVQKPERYDAYLVRRFFRLWPALFFVLVVYAGFQLAGAPIRDVDQFWSHFLLEMTMFHGLVPDQVLQDANSAISGPGWSISLEWQFYIVAPLIMAAFFKAGWRFIALLAVLLLCLVTGVLHNKVPETLAEGLVWSEPAFLPQLIGFFGLGMISYALMVKLRERETTVVYSSALIISVGLLAYNFKGPEGNFLPIMIWAMIFASIIAKDTVFHWVLDNPVARWLGSISYSTYITHMPVLILVNSYFVRDMAELGTLQKLGLMIAIAWPIALLTSVFSYYVIEKRGIAIGRAIASRLTGKPKSEFPEIQAPA